jgi:hypothetical protein
VRRGLLARRVERQSCSAGDLFSHVATGVVDVQAGGKCEVLRGRLRRQRRRRLRGRVGTQFCFDGRLTADYGEGGMPGRISGCVYRWQWNVFDLL